MDFLMENCRVGRGLGFKSLGKSRWNSRRAKQKLTKKRGFPVGSMQKMEISSGINHGKFD